MCSLPFGVDYIQLVIGILFKAIKSIKDYEYHSNGYSKGKRSSNKSFEKMLIFSRNIFKIMIIVVVIAVRFYFDTRKSAE